MLPKRKTKTDAAEILGITRVTLDKRIDLGAYTWPCEKWSRLVDEHVEFEKAGHVVDTDDQRFKRARAEKHEIEAAKERGESAPIAEFQDQMTAVFSLLVQQLDGICARLVRMCGLVWARQINEEFRSLRENIARSLDRYGESLEERARAGGAVAATGRRTVGAAGAVAADGQRGARAV